MPKRSEIYPKNFNSYKDMAGPFECKTCYSDPENFEYDIENDFYIGCGDPIWLFSNMVMIPLYEAVEDMGCEARVTSRKGSMRAKFHDGMIIYVPMEFDEQDNFGYSRVAYAYIGRSKEEADHSMMVDKWNPCSVHHINDFIKYITDDIKTSRKRRRKRRK